MELDTVKIVVLEKATNYVGTTVVIPILNSFLRCHDNR